MWPWSSSNAEAESNSESPSGSTDTLRQRSEDVLTAALPQSVQSLFPQVDVVLTKAEASLESFPRLMVAVGCFGLGGIITTAMIRYHGHRFKRLQNAEWVTPDWLDGRWVKGYVTRVGDGDNFRLFHTPFFGGHHWPLRFRSIPKTRAAQMSKTLHIRLAGVDAPEASHFGKPAQPYAAESLKWLTDTILHKTVYCQLVRRDQYSRVVANVYIPRWGIPVSFLRGRNLSLEMLKAGWATVYSQSGAEYGDIGEEGFKKLEREAKRARRGMWADGELKETPAEYKKRLAQSSPNSPGTVTGVLPPIPPQPKRRTVISKLFRRS